MAFGGRCRQLRIGFPIGERVCECSGQLPGGHHRPADAASRLLDAVHHLGTAEGREQKPAGGLARLVVQQLGREKIGIPLQVLGIGRNLENLVEDLDRRRLHLRGGRGLAGGDHGTEHQLTQVARIHNLLAQAHVEFDFRLAHAMGGRIVGEIPLRWQFPGRIEIVDGIEVKQPSLLALRQPRPALFGNPPHECAVATWREPPDAAGRRCLADLLAGEQCIVVNPVAALRTQQPVFVKCHAARLEGGFDPSRRHLPVPGQRLFLVLRRHRAVLQPLEDLLPGCQFRRRGSRGPQVVERNSPFRIVRAVAADAVGFDQRLDVAGVCGRPIRRLFGRARLDDRQPDREWHQMHPEQKPTRGHAERFRFFVAHGRVFNCKKSAPATAATWPVRV